MLVEVPFRGFGGFVKKQCKIKAERLKFKVKSMFACRSPLQWIWGFCKETMQNKAERLKFKVKSMFACRSPL
ncbi:MAG: hypothetical protein COC06_07240 [Bacteroidales bacterium]|nr:MAG: hypothetical protein COC06_07240 [Bacteroidales bacterium]